MNRASLIFASLLLLFLVSTSNGFASISSIQEQLRDIQLKLIKEKIKLTEEKISEVRKTIVLPPPPLPPERLMSRDELERTLKQQITVLESVVQSLKPKAIDEEAVRLEKFIQRLNEEIKTAEGERFEELQDEVSEALDDYADLQQQVRQSLEDNLKAQQAALIREQVKVLQEKVRALPREAPRVVVVPTPKGSNEYEKAQVKLIQDQVEKIRLKILQEQIKAIQEKILDLRQR